MGLENTSPKAYVVSSLVTTCDCGAPQFFIVSSSSKQLVEEQKKTLADSGDGQTFHKPEKGHHELYNLSLELHGVHRLVGFSYCIK